MCVDCVKIKCPDRGNICLDSGSYVLNFFECTECHRKEPIKIEDKQQETDDEGEESVSYQHKCNVCNHTIAEHQYSFRIDGEYQEYSMVCILCGRGADTVSILPTDPRKAAAFF